MRCWAENIRFGFYHFEGLTVILCASLTIFLTLQSFYIPAGRQLSFWPFPFATSCTRSSHPVQGAGPKHDRSRHWPCCFSEGISQIQSSACSMHINRQGLNREISIQMQTSHKEPCKLAVSAGSNTWKWEGAKEKKKLLSGAICRVAFCVVHLQIWGLRGQHL